MILIQALMFVLPAIAVGFFFSFPALSLIYTNLLTSQLGIRNNPIPDTFAIIQSLVLGFMIPILSSILPIKSTLSKNLSDSLDYNRSKS
jgi:ABC-type antimicrobial peptide transport system permease subunit